MTLFPKLAGPVAGMLSVTLAGAAAAQDLSGLSALDVVKLQVGAGQTADQVTEQLSGGMDAAQAQTLATDLAGQAMDPAGLSGALPIRELTYDFDAKTYKLCLPSSLLYKSEAEGGAVEALVSIRFEGLAEKNPDDCPFYKSGFIPGGALGVGNYMEIEVDMATAQKLHNAILAETSMANFTCDEVAFQQGRFDTGPTQLKCITDSVKISSEGGEMLTYSAAADDDSWITRSGDGDGGESMADSESMGTDSSENAMAGSGAESESDIAAAAAAAATAAALAATADSAAADTGSTGSTGSTDTAALAVPKTMTEGSILTETALELDKAGRIAVQRRLNLLGYNTRGVDGVFGPGTRAGITQWQYKNGMPVTGYLAADQLGALNAMSETLYVNWLAANANSATTTTKTTRTKKKRRVWRGRDGCLRRAPGNARRHIIRGQSRYCNRRRAGKI